jgi:hypothetical protein
MNVPPTWYGTIVTHPLGCTVARVIVHIHRSRVCGHEERCARGVVHARTLCPQHARIVVDVAFVDHCNSFRACETRTSSTHTYRPGFHNTCPCSMLRYSCTPTVRCCSSSRCCCAGNRMRRMLHEHARTPTHADVRFLLCVQFLP